MKTTTRQLVAGALMAALCCIMTALPKIPLGLGYVHMGDMVVFLCAFLPGGWIGVLAAGVGSALADLFAGYPDFILPTFIIKSVMALCVLLIANKEKPLGFRTIAGMLAGSVIMIGGYLAFEVLRYGSAEVAFLSAIMGNVLQAAFGIVAAYLVLIPLAKTGLIKKYHTMK